MLVERARLVEGFQTQGDSWTGGSAVEEEWDRSAEAWIRIQKIGPWEGLDDVVYRQYEAVHLIPGLRHSAPDLAHFLISAWDISWVGHIA